MQYTEEYSKCRIHNIKLFEEKKYTHHNIQISQYLDMNSYSDK